MCTPRLQRVTDCTENNGEQWVCAIVFVKHKSHISFSCHASFFFFILAPTDPLLCKFADGGQKKRQSQNKFGQNGRYWGRDGDSRLVSWWNESQLLIHGQIGIIIKGKNLRPVLWSRIWSSAMVTSDLLGSLFLFHDNSLVFAICFAITI